MDAKQAAFRKAKRGHYCTFPSSLFYPAEALTSFYPSPRMFEVNGIEYVILSLPGSNENFVLEHVNLEPTYTFTLDRDKVCFLLQAEMLAVLNTLFPEG